MLSAVSVDRPRLAIVIAVVTVIAEGLQSVRPGVPVLATPLKRLSEN